MTANQSTAHPSPNNSARQVRTYAGIGSRNTPVHIQTKMEELGEAARAPRIHPALRRSGGRRLSV